VTGGSYEEVTVQYGGKIVGRFPFVVGRRGPFRISILPPFTHLLGPAVDVGPGKPQSQLVRRLSIVRDLIDQLPSVAFFKQVYDPSDAGELAIADGLAFQDRGYTVRPQYNFQIDPGNDLDNIWHELHTTVRQHIRRAEKKTSVVALDDPEQFAFFYSQNIAKSNKSNRTDFSHFPALFSECQSRHNGEILCARDPSGVPMAMAFLVWGHGVMYYLLSTRAPDIADSGSVSLLLWTAIKRAHQLNLRFDFDGIYSSGTARFLSGFGGRIGTRLIVTRARAAYRMIQIIREEFRSTGSDRFT